MKLKALFLFVSVSILSGSLLGCAEVSVPDARNVNIPNPISAEKRREAVNERPDSVIYLPLGEDVLVPERMTGQDLPKEFVGPFELRSETLAGALQLILADYDVSIAFETDAGLTRKVTAANLKGPLDKVVSRVCSLADLYCSYEDGALIIKDTQVFTVSLPPLGGADGGDEFLGDVITGLSAVIGNGGSAPVSDPTTRTLIYSATQRTSQLAENYFERLRANTAMIVFETYIWEVSLNAGNSTGIQWNKLKSFGKFNASFNLNGSIAADFTNPVSIGLPTTGNVDPTELIDFLSQFGAVKTISQPQITVLSGSSAELRVADTENYVSEVSSTISGDNTTTSVSTDSVDSGFTLSIGSSWDRSTVYANVNINLTNVDDIEDFAFDTDGGGGQTTIQLPQTTERELATQIRIRPGDSVLIAGLVRERDNFNSRGPGFMEPIIPDSRTAQTDNLELVILLRPRVVVYTGSDDPNYKKFVNNKAEELLKSTASRRAYIPPVIDPVPVVRAPVVREAVVEAVKLPEPVIAEPVIVSPSPAIVFEAPAPLPEPISVAPAVVVKEVVKPVMPTYQRAVSVSEPVVAVPVAVSPPVAISVEPAPVVKVYQSPTPSYPQTYEPSQASGYTPGYISGQVYPSYQEAVVPKSAPVQLYAPPQPVIPAASVGVYGDVRGTGNEGYNGAPLSADIYNNAQSLNVYDVYEQSQGSQ